MDRKFAAGRLDSVALTDRESAALRGVAWGLVDKEIADEMKLSLSRVRALIRALCLGLHLSSRGLLAVWAFQNPKAMIPGARVDVTVPPVHPRGCRCESTFCVEMRRILMDHTYTKHQEKT